MLLNYLKKKRDAFISAIDDLERRRRIYSEPIEAAAVSADGHFNHFLRRKKYTIRCGSCERAWTDSWVTFMISDKASSICPRCGTQNTWFHSTFLHDLTKGKIRPID